MRTIFYRQRQHSLAPREVHQKAPDHLDGDFEQPLTALTGSTAGIVAHAAGLLEGAQLPHQPAEPRVDPIVFRWRCRHADRRVD